MRYLILLLLFASCWQPTETNTTSKIDTGTYILHVKTDTGTLVIDVEDGVIVDTLALLRGF